MSNLPVRLNLEEVTPMKKHRLVACWPSTFETLWAIGAGATAGALPA